jgi:hypothetical protein
MMLLLLALLLLLPPIVPWLLTPEPKTLSCFWSRNVFDIGAWQSSA